MKRSTTAKESRNYQVDMESDSSSQVSSQNIRERMKSFKALKTRNSSFMEYLNQAQEKNDIKMQSATLFQSERWTFKPQTTQTITKDENIQKPQRNSNKTAEENPFRRAKMNALQREKNGSSISLSAKSIEDGQEETVEEITTFRLLKRGSLNATIQYITTRQF